MPIAGTLAYVFMAVNPVGGLLFAIPFAVLKLHLSPALAVVSGVPLAYVQVVAVDWGWDFLLRISWWRELLERRRSPLAERLLASKGSFWLTYVASPILGPWAVMAVMRYARVPQRRVALPIVLSLATFAAVVSVMCAGLLRP
jgi:hypothetical protein